MVALTLLFTPGAGAQSTDAPFGTGGTVGGVAGEIDYRPNLPGVAIVFNTDPTGSDKAIDRVELQAGELRRLGPCQFALDRLSVDELERGEIAPRETRIVLVHRADAGGWASPDAAPIGDASAEIPRLHLSANGGHHRRRGGSDHPVPPPPRR